MTALRSYLHLPTRLAFTARRWGLAWARIFYLGAVVLVLMVSPSTYSRGTRGRLARHLVQGTAPILLGFTLLAALLAVVITRIVVVTAESYGLTRYALEMVIRVLVLELIPLTAALFVAMRATIPSGTQLALLRQSGYLQALTERGADPVRMELLPRVIAGLYASVTLAALSCVVALLMAYLGVYGFTLAGLPGYTRMFGHVFTPQITLVFALRTLLFGMAISLIPMASGLYESRVPGRAQQPASEMGGLARMFAVLLLIEVLSLMSNYYY